MNFCYIKADWHKAKLIEIRRLYQLNRKNGGWSAVRLGISRMSDLLKPVWEKHFSPHYNAAAWNAIGVYPFTR